MTTEDSFTELEGTNRQVQVLQPKNRLKQLRKPVSPGGIRTKGLDTAKYQVWSKGS